MDGCGRVFSGFCAEPVRQDRDSRRTNRSRPIEKLSKDCVRTPSGGETQVTGAITLPVEWEGETKDLEFMIVPGLTQRFYFEINFWDKFGLTFLGKGGREVAARLPPLKQHRISTL